MHKLMIALLFIGSLLASCNTSTNDNNERTEETYGEEESSDQGSENENYYEEERDDEENESDDGYIGDGTYTSDVEYYNPKTGTRSYYTLDVDVHDNQVTKIYFPRGGWLDGDHFDSSELENGSTSIETDEGVTYDIDIDQ
jgi:hypothetical protein